MKHDVMFGAQKVSLVISDIDDTLLHKSTKIAEDIQREIVSLRERGVSFTLASGRLPYEMEFLYEGIPFDVPYVANNGAILKDKAEVFYDDKMCPQPLKAIAEKYSARGVTILFSVDSLERPLIHTEWTKSNQGLFPGLDNPVGTDIWKQRIHRMYFYHPQELYLEECMMDLRAFEQQYSICYQNKKSIQVCAYGHTKASGVKQLSKMCEIPMDEILCIGDSYNDIEMIKCAGIGAAVGNACDELKQVADYCCIGKHDRGVLEVLQRLK